MGAINYRKSLWTLKDQKEWWQQYTEMVNAAYDQAQQNGETAPNCESGISVFQGSGNAGRGAYPGSGRYPSSGRAPMSGNFTSSGRLASSGLLTTSGRLASSGLYTASGFYTSSGRFTASGRFGMGSGPSSAGSSGLSSFRGSRFGSGTGSAGICALGYGIRLL